MIPDYDRATRMAYKTLLALHVEELPIDPLQIISYCKNVIVHTYDDLMAQCGETSRFIFKTYYADGKDALLFRNELENGQAVYELYYDSHGNIFRRRFTLAHELGHIILKHRMEEKWEEQEADCFAAQLLAPRPLFQTLHSNGVNIFSPGVVGRVFCLSDQAARISAPAVLYNMTDEISLQLQKQFAGYIQSISDILENTSLR